MSTKDSKADARQRFRDLVDRVGEDPCALSFGAEDVPMPTVHAILMEVVNETELVGVFTSEEKALAAIPAAQASLPYRKYTEDREWRKQLSTAAFAKHMWCCNGVSCWIRSVPLDCILTDPEQRRAWQR